MIDDSLPPGNDEPQIPDTRLEPRSDKESPEVEITNDEEGRSNVESFPLLGINDIKEQVKKQVPEQVRDQVPVYVAKGLIMERQKTKEEMERMIAKAILQEHGNIQAKISSQIHKAINHHIPSQVDTSVRSYMPGHILLVHPAQSQTLSVLEQQYQLYLSMKNDPQLQQQDIAIWLALQMKFEISRRCYDFWTDSYASDDDEIPMKQVSQDIMKEVSLTIDEAKLKKMADEMLRQRCTSGDEHQYHIDQMKNLLKSDIKMFRPEKIVLSLHKFPAIIFNDDDIEERTSRWIVARRANECIVSITEPDYKNLNKNDIKDMYLLIMNGKVPDYAETGLLWSLSVFIRSSVIWERVHDFQLGIESYQHKISKKEIRVMRIHEIHSLCDANVNKVLEVKGLQ
ncbi:hypothetical protein Tco_0767029 [Tanacetum coccineum]